MQNYGGYMLEIIRNWTQIAIFFFSISLDTIRHENLNKIMSLTSLYLFLLQFLFVLRNVMLYI